MIILSESEFLRLKAEIKEEVIKDFNINNRGSIPVIAFRGYRDIFNRHFPASEYPDADRMSKVKNALATANNVLRQRVMSKYSSDRSTGVKNEVELQNAWDTYEKLCIAFKEAYQDDISV